MSDELLDININLVHKNWERTLRKANVFGLGWLGDGSTIKTMPLLNMFVMYGGDAPVFSLVSNCTDHMVDGK